MLPSLRTILAAMCLTAIVVVLVGAALMPRPDPYGHSTAFSGIGQPENSESQQLLKLGHTRRVDELNRLLTLPTPTDDSGASEGGTSTYVKQGGDVVVGEQTAAGADEQRSDPIVTGSVQDRPVASDPPPPVTSAATTEAVAPSADLAPKIASTQPTTSEGENAQNADSDAPIMVMPLPRPKLTNAIRHPIRVERSTIAENARGSGTSTPNSASDTSSLNHIDSRSARARTRAPTAQVTADRPGRDINIP
jgi:hypothetical protein